MNGTETLDITLNGEPFATRATTLADLVVEAGFGDAKVATAVNGSFVSTGERQRTTINKGDKVEVLSARQGG
jgi:sulfur carrier protein